MTAAIADYGFIGDCHTGALIDREGNLAWLCMPRFDSGALFGALLGHEEHGQWTLRPEDPNATPTRRYLPDTFVLETTWTTETGQAVVTEFMPVQQQRASVVRRLTGVRGTVQMRHTLRIRFEYASQLPWVRQAGSNASPALLATAGPNSVVVHGPRLEADGLTHTSLVTLEPGDVVDTVLTWYPSHRDAPEPLDVDAALLHTEFWWRDWASACAMGSSYSDATHRSLLILRALTHEKTGGIVAAATTSLPESIGGSRNWDYRYVWLRDASLALSAMLTHGFQAGAQKWRRWLLRAVAGDPDAVQIMYGIAGERDLPEKELPTLPGYRDSAPVRTGNEAYLQFQTDVFGETLVALHDARIAGLTETSESWALQRALLTHLEDVWEDPDNGIWEVRGPRRVFTQSRVMAWAAFDRGVKAIEEHGLHGPLERWRSIRDRIRRDVFDNGFDENRRTFVQFYGSTDVDAALLTLPQVGFVAADDPAMLGTVRAIEEDLLDAESGLVLRYSTASGVDGVPGEENAFLACAFWLVEQYARSGRVGDAERGMQRLLGYANDVGLLPEEIEIATGHHAGNTPQAFSHLALINAADAINAAHHEAKPVTVA